REPVAAARVDERLADAAGPLAPDLRPRAVRILLDRLASLLRQHDALGLPVVRILVVSVPIAYVFGHLFGEAIYSTLNPDERYFNAFRGSHFEISALLGGIT